MKIAAFTMVHNEHNMLPLWMRHYGQLVGFENCYVIDHGSTDGSTFPFAANTVRVPRRFNGADIRLPIVNGMQQMLLTEYDVVIYTDCDEFLVVDPARHASLEAALEANDAPLIRCLGADIVHLPKYEPEPLNFRAPILEQRHYWYYSRPISKPIITRVRADWVPGFHFVRGNEALEANPAFLLLHMRWADRTHALERMRMTRSMQWSPTAMNLGWGAHARQGDEEVEAFFRAKESGTAEQAEEFDLAVDGANPETLYGKVRAIYPRLQGRF